MITLFSASVILFFAPSAPPPAFQPSYQFNDNRNSQYLATLAAWPLAPLVVP